MSDSDRYAAVDIGTNSVLMVAAQQSGEPGMVDCLYDRSIIAGLGRGADEQGRLHPDSIQRAVDAVGELLAVADSLGIPKESRIITGTAALRRASNSEQFQEALERATGTRVRIIPGDLEARLSTKAVLAGLPGRSRVRIADIGGGSTEIIDLVEGETTYARSFPIGSVRVTEEILRGDPPSKESLLNAARRVRDLIFSTASSRSPPSRCAITS